MKKTKEMQSTNAKSKRKADQAAGNDAEISDVEDDGHFPSSPASPAFPTIETIVTSDKGSLKRREGYKIRTGKFSERETELRQHEHERNNELAARFRLLDHKRGVRRRIS